MRWKLRAADAAETGGKDPECYHRGASPAACSRQAQRSVLLPASIDEKGATTPVGYPDAGSIETPALTEYAAGMGLLAHESRLPAAPEIDLAQVVAVVIAVAMQADLTIPVSRLPLAVMVMLPLPAVVTIMASAASAGDLGKACAATAVHPQPLPVHAPATATHARGTRVLPDQSRIAPHHRATMIVIVPAFALGGATSVVATALGVCRRSHRHGCQAEEHRR